MSFIAPTTPPLPLKRRLLGFRGLTALCLAAGTTYGAVTFVHDARAGAQELQDLVQENRAGIITRTRPLVPLSTLIRTYVVYAFCSLPALVDWSPAIVDALLSIPGLKSITEGLVRATFFNQFVGGDTAEDAFPLIDELRAQNTGCLFAYSVEVDEAVTSGKGTDRAVSTVSGSSVHKQIVQQTLHCVDVAANYEDRHSTGRKGRRTWVAIKLSAMVPNAETLRRLSVYLVATRRSDNPRIAFPGCPLPSDLDVLSSSLTAGPLTESDLVALRELHEDLVAICTRAQERGVRLIFDAEYRMRTLTMGVGLSWYQPAIDAFTLHMMRRFNKLPSPARSSWFTFGSTKTDRKEETVAISQPLVYATYQAYLRRTPEYLAQSIAAARKDGYSLGVKLVRGAYHPHEVAAHRATAIATSADSAPVVSDSAARPPRSLSISPEPVPPVWLEKAETDARYNACARMLVEAVRADVERENLKQGGKFEGTQPSLGVLFGTHNWESADIIVDEIVRQGLGVESEAEDGVVVVGDAVAERVTMGQLYGMTAALTKYLVDRVQSSAPFVIKYIPYGRLSEVMPYLSRRAIENKSVLGNGAAQEERRRAAAEIVTRLFG